MWPLLEQKPECIKDTEPVAKLARSWTANLSSERLDYTVEWRQAIEFTKAKIMTSQTQCEGLWIFCDEKGTWVVITYATPKDTTCAQRNLRQIFKFCGKEVLNTIEQTRRYFNESHKDRIEQFKIRKEILYQADVFKSTKPKACKEDLSAYFAAHELALATPMPRVPEGMPPIPYHGTVALLFNQSEQLNLDIQELTEAREKCKAVRDALNAKGGLAESPEHLEFEAKSLKVIAYDQEIKKHQAEIKSIHAKMTSEKERAAEFVEDCDKEHGNTYALWPLGDCGCLLPRAQIFVKGMRDEKDREQFLQESISMSMAEEHTSDGIATGKDVLLAAIKKTTEMQENGTLPTDANSHDRARTRKRVSNVCTKMTGEAPNKDIVKLLFDKEEGCHFQNVCGHKGVTVYCKQGGGPCFLVEKTWEEDQTGNTGIVKFCSELCCKRYRAQPICKRCNNEDRNQMYCTKQVCIYGGDVMKDWKCKHCRVPCESRDPGVWIVPRKEMSCSIQDPDINLS